MCQVNRSNFDSLLPSIKVNISKCAFYAVDTEFTGLKIDEDDRPSLFDSGPDRYKKLRKIVSKFTVCQLGLALFVPDSERNKYTVYAYNIQLFPPSFGPLDTKFLCQASSLQFLSKHNFDFNRFVYEGVPYLNSNEERVLEEYLDRQDHLQGYEREADENYVRECCSQVAEWMQSASEDQTITLPVTCDASTAFCLVAEIRCRFPQLWAAEDDMNVIVRVVSPEKKAQLLQEHQTHEKKKIMDAQLGFTHVFRCLVKRKVPFLGHNNFTDLMFLYDKLHKPLPASYKQFKSDIHELFPIVYDTKHISNNLRRSLEKTGLFDSTCLGALYQSLDCEKGRLHVLLQPDITFAVEHNAYRNVFVPHEAGYDAFMCGYVFLRILHIVLNKDTPSTKIRHMSIIDYLAAAKVYINKVNLIRASINCVVLDGNDPASKRPETLHVYSKQPINTGEMFSKHGTVDVQLLSQHRALVAVGNFASYREIIKAFKKSKDIKIEKYRLLKHSVLAQGICVGTLVIGGAVCALGIYKLFK